MTPATPGDLALFAVILAALCLASGGLLWLVLTVGGRALDRNRADDLMDLADAVQRPAQRPVPYTLLATDDIDPAWLARLRERVVAEARRINEERNR